MWLCGSFAEILSYLARHRSEWIGCHAATSNGISSNWQCLRLGRCLCLAFFAQLKVKGNVKAKRRKCQWHNDNDNYNDSEHNAKGRTSWRVNLCGPMRKPKSFASFTCSVLPLGMWVFVCVCVCTSVLAAETAQRMPRTWSDIESQMPDRKGRQARTCTCMPTPQVKLRKI